MPPTPQQIFTKAAFELVAVIAFGAGFLVVHNQDPFVRGFYCDDEALKHPYTEPQRFPADLAFVIWLIVKFWFKVGLTNGINGYRLT